MFVEIMGARRWGSQHDRSLFLRVFSRSVRDLESEQRALLSPNDWQSRSLAYQRLGVELLRLVTLTIAVVMSGASQGNRRRV
jgi:hypothetical protein